MGDSAARRASRKYFKPLATVLLLAGTYVISYYFVRSEFMESDIGIELPDNLLGHIGYVIYEPMCLVTGDDKGYHGEFVAADAVGFKGLVTHVEDRSVSIREIEELYDKSARPIEDGDELLILRKSVVIAYVVVASVNGRVIASDLQPHSPVSNGLSVQTGDQVMRPISEQGHF